MASEIKDKPSLTFTRHYSVPPEKVWDAWTNPQALKQWFGPDEGRVEIAEVDARVGGRYRILFHTQDGQSHDVSGTYREIRRPAKLSFTWAWKSTPERESLVTLTFEPSGGGTEFTMLHSRFFDDTARDNHQKGWTGAIAKLDRYLAA
ncbi:MAG TPA: SRPBCC domain-containing protein [Burkholderiales bacterium]|nr:SRPBCC domain-containing protein [Burkholderiales bacterium]